MKKRNLNSLKLNKKSISNLGMSSATGGMTISCQPIGICAETQGCETDNGCPTDNGCVTNGCTNICPPSNRCPTISCQPIGICPR